MRKVLIIFLMILAVNVVVADQVMLSDQGTGVKAKGSGDLITSATIKIEIYDAMNFGNLIYEEVFVNGIVNGNWNLILGANASNPLNLKYGKVYYKDYKVDGKDIDFKSSSGETVPRQIFYSTVGGFDNLNLVPYNSAENDVDLGSYKILAKNIRSGTESLNVFFGSDADDEMLNTSSVFGEAAGGMASGVANSFFGTASGAFSIGNYNSFFGASSGVLNEGSNVIGLGQNAAKYNRGLRVISIGAYAGENNTASDSIYIGANVGVANSKNKRLMIDIEKTETPLIDGDFASNLLTVNGDLNVTGSIYGVVGGLWTNNSGVATYGGDIDIQNIISGGNFVELKYVNITSVDVGKGVIRSLIYLGKNAGLNSNNRGGVVIGNSAGENMAAFEPIAIGESAGHSGIGDNLVAIGTSAGQDNLGKDLLALGRMAGMGNSGNYTIALGYGAGVGNSGNSMISIGESAGSDTSGSYGISIGDRAGLESVGEENIFIGHRSGFQSKGSNVIAIGHETAYSASSNNSIFIGPVGKNLNKNNVLMIDNRDTSTPLIYGDFQAENLVINGNLNVTRNIYLKGCIVIEGNQTIGNCI